MDVSCATEVWIATALLHKEQPEQPHFPVTKIVDKAYSLELAPTRRPGTVMHATQHTVANKPPNPTDLRLLYETERGRRRLFRPGDDFDPGREKGATVPAEHDLPDQYVELLIWYKDDYCARAMANA